jgi:hypothetical protein
MSLRGALAAFDSDEKHLVLIFRQAVSKYVDDHHQKGAMKLPLPETGAVCMGEGPASDGN